MDDPFLMFYSVSAFELRTPVNHRIYSVYVVGKVEATPVTHVAVC